MVVEAKRLAGLVVLGAGVVASFTHHVLFFSTHPGSFLDLSLSLIPPSLVLWTGLGVVAYEYRADVDESQLGRIAVWYVAGGVVFGTAAYASLRVNLVAGVPFAAIRLSVANWAIGGSFIGLLLGFYDARRSAAVREAKSRQREADRQAQRVSVLNRVLRHDIRNKLTIIVGHADLLAANGAGESPGAIKRAAEDLLDIADRVRNLHTVSQERTRQPVNLAECVSRSIADVRETYPAVQITTDLAGDSTAFTYPIIEDNILDLIQNAVIHNDHAEADIVIDIALHRVRRDAEPYCELVIEDNGPGIPPLEQVVLDERSETPLAHSLGTGLWLTRWVVEESNGVFDFSERPAGGTRMVLQLPTAP